MTNYIIKQDQTIYDIALQLYGDASDVWKLIDQNSVIQNLDTDLVRLTIVYDETDFTDNTIYFKTNNINITTGGGDTYY